MEECFGTCYNNEEVEDNAGVEEDDMSKDGDDSGNYIITQDSDEDSVDPTSPPRVPREASAAQIIASNERVPVHPGGECRLNEHDEQVARALHAEEYSEDSEDDSDSDSA